MWSPKTKFMKIRTLARRKAKTAFTPNRSFTNFQALPAEIRYEIWAWSFPDRRIIYLQKSRRPIPGTLQDSSIGASSPTESQDSTSTSQTNNQESDMVYWSDTETPEIYSVCRESQAVFKQFYTKAFANSNFPGVWFDFRVDILYVARDIYERESIFYENFRSDIRQVKILFISGMWDPDSVEIPNPLYQIGSILDVGAAIRGFKNLEGLMLAHALHPTNQTGILYCGSMCSNEEYIQFLWQSEHPVVCPEYCEVHGWYSWPRIDFGTMLAFDDYLLQRKRLRRRIGYLQWQSECLLSDISWWFRRVSG